MLDNAPAPLDETITIAELTRDPYPLYKRLRADTPVLRVKALGRTLLTRAEDTRAVKENTEVFSADDPNTPMKRAFHAHTLMRKDGTEHRAERMAMAPAYSPKALKAHWLPMYETFATEYLDRLPRDDRPKRFQHPSVDPRLLSVVQVHPGLRNGRSAHGHDGGTHDCGKYRVAQAVITRPAEADGRDMAHEENNVPAGPSAPRLGPDGRLLSRPALRDRRCQIVGLVGPIN